MAAGGPQTLPTSHPLYSATARTLSMSIIRPHRSASAINVAYFYADVAWSACLCASVGHNREPYKNG